MGKPISAFASHAQITRKRRSRAGYIRFINKIIKSDLQTIHQSDAKIPRSFLGAWTLISAVRKHWRDGKPAITT